MIKAKVMKFLGAIWHKSRGRFFWRKRMSGWEYAAVAYCVFDDNGNEKWMSRASRMSDNWESPVDKAIYRSSDSFDEPEEAIAAAELALRNYFVSIGFSEKI